jgi:two-component system sensor histidine kinase RegB
MTPHSTTWSPALSAAVSSTAPPHERLSGMIAVRWWAIAALLLTVAAAPKLLGAPLPQLPMLAILAAVGAWNGLMQWQLRGTVAAPDSPSVFLQFCIDLLAFAALLYFSGGATNPLVFMLLLPVVLSALLLSRRAVVAISTLAILLYSLLMVQFVPLELGDAARAATLHLTGMWLTFVVSAAMLAWFVMRTTNALRRRDAELARAREQTYRDERVLALGALAAGAAHELGSPLATLAILVGEMERDAQADSTASADLKLMREQIAYCKRIITRLTERAGDQRSEGAESMRCDAWMEGVHSAWRSLRGDCVSSFTLLGSADSEPPVIIVEPTLGQSVVSVLDNALRAGTPVDVALDWNAEEVHIEIRDNGPGFTDDVLQKAGRQTFGEEAHGNGLGLLLATASLDRVGGRLELSNPWTGGARVLIRLPLDRIGLHV